MSELLPCPFCEAKPETLTDGKRTWGLVMHRDGCLFPTWPKHEIPEHDFEAWNTRAERTCKNVGYYVDSTRFECSECGFNGWTKWAADGKDKVSNYCPNCGAKVVDDD